ncbi:MAG TPA: AAA family ATPase [Steroidobacteraceae bacterium]|jgi:predicted kinase|nr:AAA family ATPase [Steroidobacteraceae bacterium]
MNALTEKLTIILGCPASGKTTLARRLAVDRSLPILCKDDIKEALFDTLGPGDRQRSRRFSEASFAALARLAGSQLALGRACILEGNWRPDHEGLLAGVMGANRALQICCCADPEEIVRRFCSRSRHPGHLDASMLRPEIEQAARRPPTFLNLPGRRLLFRSDAADAYAELLRSL